MSADNPLEREVMEEVIMGQLLQKVDREDHELVLTVVVQTILSKIVQNP
jgi:hypothetical protein